jgi:hypothetical protein
MSKRMDNEESLNQMLKNENNGYDENNILLRCSPLSMFLAWTATQMVACAISTSVVEILSKRTMLSTALGSYRLSIVDVIRIGYLLLLSCLQQMYWLQQLHWQQNVIWKKNNFQHNQNNYPSNDADLFEASDVEDGVVEVVKVYKVEHNGMANCHVGYLPRRLYLKHSVNKLYSLFLCVKEDLRSSPSCCVEARYKIKYVQFLHNCLYQLSLSKVFCHQIN